MVKLNQEFNFAFFVTGTFIRRKNRSSVQNVGKDFVNQGPWRFTRSFTWKSLLTNAPFAVEVSIKGLISRPIYLPTPTTSLMNATRVEKFSEGTAICVAMH